MAAKTQYYDLAKPSLEEIADIEPINANMDKIDLQMRRNSDGVNFAKGLVADSYNEAGTYSVGDYCVYDNKLYRCITAITSAESFNADKWTETQVCDEVKNSGGGGGGTITVDSVLSDTSTNPVQNKVITEEFNEINNNLDGLKYSDVAGGKNILNTKLLRYGDYNGANKNIRITIDLADRIYVPSGTDIAFSFTPTSKINVIWLIITDSDNNIIEFLAYQSSTNVIKKNTKSGYITPIFGFSSDDNSWGEITIQDVIDCNPHIELNSVATPYEPFIPSVKMLTDELEAQNDSLSVIGKCKNLLKPTFETITSGGVTCTNNRDGTYTLNGTNTSETRTIYLMLKQNAIYRNNRKLKFVGCPKDMDSSSCFLYIENGGSACCDFGNGVYLSDDNCPDILSIGIAVSPGFVCENLVFKPMITTNLNATYDDFIPYTGDGETLTHDVAELKNDLVSLKNLFSSNITGIKLNGTTLEVSFNNGTSKGIVTFDGIVEEETIIS